MATLRVRDSLSDRILISRESARLLEGEVERLLAGVESTEQGSRGAPVIIDFDGVEGIAPSFLDELLTVFESLMALKPTYGKCRLVVANPPTRLSRKFEAVARGHAMTAQALPNGSWELTSSDGAGDSCSKSSA